MLALACLAALPLRAGDKQKAAEEAGAALFRAQDCGHCHGEAGIGGKKGPPLTDIRKDKVWPPERIAKQILNGGQKMPPFGESLTDEQVAELVAFLRAKHRPPVPPPAAER